jgi:Putative transposase, YhgA-like
VSIRRRFREFVRNFPQNGMKLLLEDPANVRELLQILEYSAVDRIVFDEMTVQRTTYVAPDYRHIEADVVLTAPCRIGKSPRSRRRITLYVLIEHQSEPDRLIVFRVLEYVVQIYKTQFRDWQKEHGSLNEFEFQPVLPIVFYTGARSWKRLRSFGSLTAGQALFGRLLPRMSPLFLNLRATTTGRLRQQGMSFARILELLRARDEDLPHLLQLLREVMHDLRELPQCEHNR